MQYGIPIKHVPLNNHHTIPPLADAGWIGEAGPGPSYLDPGSDGPENDFTNRKTTFMTWNLMHLARILKDVGGIPVYGDRVDAPCLAITFRDRQGWMFGST